MKLTTLIALTGAAQAIKLQHKASVLVAPTNEQMLKLSGKLTDADKKLLSSLNGDAAHDEAVLQHAGDAEAEHL